MKRLLLIILALSLCCVAEARRRWVPAASASVPQTASDDFNGYTNLANLGSQTNWANVAGTMLVAKPIAKGYAFGSSSADNVVRYTAGTWSANQYSEITVGGPAGASSLQFPGGAVRCTGSGDAYYFAADGGNVYLSVYNGGSKTFLTSAASTNVSGTVLRIEVTGSGSSTRITIKRNGSAVLSSYDPGGTYISSGNPGVAGGGVGTVTELGISNWSASDN